MQVLNKTTVIIYVNIFTLHYQIFTTWHLPDSTIMHVLVYYSTLLKNFLK